ncbi:hypothetical protein ACHHYP_00649 [Achlya hypogyna]|uniref:Uncharacterized protein n=1 Tax=Achlya hypogyna TaxID=1202772 RepID=A0A1V9ZAJ1_ACHHY|nr:hypothetical protein ACHHYP_00649 [Achlya hypogyna]
MNNPSSIAAAVSLNMTLPGIQVPPSTGVTDTYMVGLFDNANHPVATITALGPVLQPAPLSLGYVGAQSLRAGSDAGLMVVFSTALSIPPNGELLLELNPSYQVNTNTSLHMLNDNGGYSLTRGSSSLKVTRSGNGTPIGTGSTVAFWLTSLLNPPTDGIAASPGVLNTATYEGFVLESTPLTTMPIYSAAVSCLGQCVKGYFASAFNATVDTCTPCGAGYFCAGGCAPATPCPVGTYSPAPLATNVSTCQLCPSGSTAITPGMAACVPCPAGSLCPSSSQAPTFLPRWSKLYISLNGAVTVCSRYLQRNGQPELHHVPSGRRLCFDVAASYAVCLGHVCGSWPNNLFLVRSWLHVPVTGGDATTLRQWLLLKRQQRQLHRVPRWRLLRVDINATRAMHPGDVQASLPASTACTMCPAGMQCPTLTASPIACVAGTFSGAGQTNCTLCPTGFVCPTTTSVVPIPCSPGSYSATGATACTVCPAGKYCPYVNQTIALACTPGTFSLGAATANCTLCPAAGYFSVGGAAACTKCPAGFACPSTTSDIALPCDPGYYSIGGQTACVPCAAGFACPDPTSSARTACAFGTFSGGAQSSCTPCPAGFLCPSVSNSSIAACGPGLFSVAGQGTCTPCPAGFSCSNMSTTPQPCAPGYYSLAGQVACIPCNPGYECPHPDQPPQPCPIGYWSPGTILNCLECHPGYRCSLASTSPTPPEDACPAGGYCNPPTTFFMCPPGTYGNTTAGESVNQACAPCPPGYTCASGSTAVSMQPCPAGFYCPLGTQAGWALPCPAGQYNPSPYAVSALTCLDCPAGSYCPAGSPWPILCPSGSFCPALTQSATQFQCPAGTYGGNNTGSITGSQCLPCVVGSYCPQGSVSPTPCPAGRYNPSTKASGLYECLLCPQGWSCPHVGQIAYTDRCSPGYYCPVGTVAATSYPCPAGTYTDAIDLVRIDDCTICPQRFACLSGTGNNVLQMLPCAAGFFCPNGTEFPRQYPCPPGYWSPVGSLASASECTICPPGSYCAGGNSVIDGPCSPGHYCPIGTALSTAYPCPSGTYTALTNLTDPTQCSACPPGSYCPTGSVAPIKCPPGTYTTVYNTAQPGPGVFPMCTTCPSGNYCPLGSVAPVPCGVGKMSPMGSFSCQTCPAGFFCGSNTTATELLPTSAGSWDLRGSLFGRCYNGTYCPPSMSYEPTLDTNACPLGYYCPMAVPAPIYCPAGTFNNVTGQDSLADCIPTPAGYYSLPASIVPTGICATGYFCPSMSTTSTQVPCPPRYFLNRTQGRSQDDCAVCPAGKYCTVASSVPIDCPRGYYCITGTSNPEPCPLGTFGNATNLKMMEDCFTCLPGMYCDGTALTNPSGPCDAGFYCTGGSYTSAPSGSAGAQSFSDCTNCPPGLYCQSSGLSLPTDLCAAGYYCVSAATTPTQYESPIGFFSGAGAYSPSACPPGTYNNQVRQSTCAACPERFYCNGTATVQPAVCPQGYYCPLNTALPQKCPAGSYSNLTGLAASSDCLSCPPGSFCQTSGLVQPSGPCMAGYTCTGGDALLSCSATYGSLHRRIVPESK